MSMEIGENTLGIWFVSWEEADWLGSVWRTSDGIRGSYRFRYYRDDKAFNSRDEKSWCDLKETKERNRESEWIEVMTKMAEAIAYARNGKKWELIRGSSSAEQFREQFMKLPFVHAKKLSPEECRFVMKEHGVSITVTAIHKESGKRASATGPANRKAEVRTAALMNLGELLYGSPEEHMTRTRTRVPVR